MNTPPTTISHAQMAKEILLRTGAWVKRQIESGISREVVLQKAGERLLGMKSCFDDDAFDSFCEMFATLGPSVALAWCESGFPMLEPSHTLAASLMMTKLPVNTVTDQDMPWRAFGVWVPPSVLRDEPAFALIVKSKSKPVVYSWTFGFMAGIDFGEEPGFGDYCNIELQRPDEWNHEASDSFDQYSRGVLLSGRLLVGCALELNSRRSELEKSQRKQDRQTYLSRSLKEPKAWVWRLTRNVQLDATQYVKQYLKGTIGRKVAIQTMVRGHWKNQVCGIGRSERKWIHIEPYWRGPEDAPIGVRSHVMGDSSP